MFMKCLNAYNIINTFINCQIICISLKTVLKKIGSRTYVEIPSSFVKLYDIKDNSKARCKIKEINDTLIINIETKIPEQP